MSQENVAVVRAVYASVDRGIDKELWDLVPPEFVADFSRQLVEPEVLRGPEQVRPRISRFREAWGEGYRNEPEELACT